LIARGEDWRDKTHFRSTGVLVFVALKK
jgi:hypothetical protein